VKGFSFSSGGCINNGGRLQTNQGDFFLKWNDAARYPGMLNAEALGLQKLLSASVIRIPNVVLVNQTAKFQFLLLEFIEHGTPSLKHWQLFGEQLAALHRISAEMYGFPSDNYIGSLPQSNQHGNDWIKFFIAKRLSPQVDLAIKSGKITSNVEGMFFKLYEKLPLLITKEKPALLHGDLWSGNKLVDNMGNPCLIDPAVYSGHREVDIGFTKLFGGFPQAFYDSYNAHFPLENGLEERLRIYNLYPLLVHLNLFGETYLNQVVSILKHFV
jgi:protein-ribulosamine 3-kinase